MKLEEGTSMAKKHSPTNRIVEPPRIDDLKLINGIGPGVEKRLNGVGIFTFAQLAALSSADIAAAVADLAGKSAERIIKQDWIGQARKLAAGSAARETQKGVEAPTPKEHDPDETLSVESQKDTAPSVADYRPAMFTVELLLDEHNNVHSTHVTHVQSRREHTWTGWPKAELVDFLGQSAGVNVSAEELVPAKAEEPVPALALVAESKPLTSEAAQPGLAGTLHLRDMKITADESLSPRRTLSHEQPFGVRLTLDLTEMTVPGDTPLNYKASIYGKSRGSRSGQVVGEVEGTIKPTETTFTIVVEGNPLPEGVYRLAATVAISLPDTKPTVKRGTLAVVDGGQVQVF
jgi:hypothetical protein